MEMDDEVGYEDEDQPATTAMDGELGDTLTTPTLNGRAEQELTPNTTIVGAGLEDIFTTMTLDSDIVALGFPWNGTLIPRGARYAA